jgi:DNA-binding XRE family transcriptional regulator
MTKAIHASSVSSPSTTASGFPETVRRTLAAVPATRGTPVVVLEPVNVRAPLPEGFMDIEDFIAQEERDPVVKQAVAAGNKVIAEQYYADGPQRLAYYRLRNGWSQKELASRVGTSQSYIARLEAGEIDPQVSTLNRLADALQVAPSEILHAVTAGAKAS